MSKALPLEKFLPDNFTVSNQEKKLHHIFDEADCYALWAAYSAGRPLLVRGKPGTGKSQMAKAIAEHLGWAYVEEVIRGSTELSDLHWHFDAIGRLGEAQAMSQQLSAQERADILKPMNYLSPGAFWWAYDWKTATSQYHNCTSGIRCKPENPGTTAEPPGVVILLDEIDKAEPDLPNGLLETLGQFQFTVPYINQDLADQSKIVINNPIKAQSRNLLVIIATNEERELPSAFVRRCFVHTLKIEESAELQQGIEKRHQWLIERGQLHFAGKISDQVYQKAAELLWQDRTEKAFNRYTPGLAEYIDMLNALQDLRHEEQEQRLDKIARYALVKEGNV